MKKCFVTDPDTNLGVPVELTAADVRPYFEHQELLGRLPASDFAPHLFDEGQELPFSLPFDKPEEGKLPDNRLEQGHKPVSVAVEEPVPAPLVLEPTPVPKPPAPQLPDESIPPQELTTPAEPEPPLPRRRGRPVGSKNKPRICPNCTVSSKCVAHCKFCKGGRACDSHTAQDCCAKCTKTRLCIAHC